MGLVIDWLGAEMDPEGDDASTPAPPEPLPQHWKTWQRWWWTRWEDEAEKDEAPAKS